MIKGKEQKGKERRGGEMRGGERREEMGNRRCRRSSQVVSGRFRAP